MKTHKTNEPKSGSMLKWVVKRVKSERKPKPKMAIEMKPIVKTRQLKLRKPTFQRKTVVSNPVRPRPPRTPRRSKQPPLDTSPFMAPANLTDPALDKQSPQFRIAHIQHFKSLKSDFPVLDKTMYHKTNKSCLGVTLRRFQQWFQQYDADLDAVKKSKPKKERYQNKVLFQGDRVRFTAKQKYELIQQFDQAELPEREAFSDEDSDEEDSDFEEFVIPKKKQAKPKRGADEAASLKRIKPNPNPHPKEFSASHNHKQASTKKTPSGINGSARTAFWPASKAIQAESIEGVILSLSKII